MKRFLSVLLAFALILACVPATFVTVNANSALTPGMGGGIVDNPFDDWGDLVDGYYTYGISNGEATITDYATSMSGNVDIPDTLGGYPVTSIGYMAFSGCSSLTSVTIPDSVTSIGSSAFSFCSSLTSIEIPDSVTSIGYMAFSGCSSLTGIWVDENNAEYCSDEYGVLYNKDKTTLIQAPGGITGFYTIPDSVTTINAYAFEDCSSLASVVIGDSVTSIGDSAFSDCSSLTSIEIPYGVTSIGGGVFSNCSSLTSIEIPDSVTNIGWLAFFDCSSLTDVYYSGTVEQWNAISIDSGNEPLTYATIHFADDDVEDENPCIQYLTWDIIDGEATITDCDESISGDITIPATLGGYPVTSIGEDAFWNCSSLTSVTIPDSVTSIGEYAFFDCSSLTSVTIGNGVTSIGDWAFFDCSSLTSVTIGNGVTSIGDAAFWNCSSLTSITIPDSVTSIGSDAFEGCDSLKYNIFDNTIYLGNDDNPYRILVEVVSDYYATYCKIHEDTKLICSYAFWHCRNLTDVYYGGTREEKDDLIIGGGNEELLSATWHCAGETVLHKQGKENTHYSTLEEALAVTDGTITLLADVTADVVSINPGVTLDLNGYTLNATSIEGKVMDSADGKGLVKVGAKNAVLTSNGDQLILWDNATENPGYRVFNYTFTNMGMDAHKDDAIESAKRGTTLKSFWSDLTFTNSYAYTLAASSYSGLSVGFEVSWTPENGETTGKTFNFTAATIAEWGAAEEGNAGDQNYCFYIGLTGFDDLLTDGTVTVKPVMKTAFNAAEAEVTQLVYESIKAIDILNFEQGIGNVRAANIG